MRRAAHGLPQQCPEHDRRPRGRHGAIRPHPDGILGNHDGAVRPGRNLAIILEVAAMNNRQKKMGYNAAAEFTEQINRHFDETAGQSF